MKLYKPILLVVEFFGKSNHTNAVVADLVQWVFIAVKCGTKFPDCTCADTACPSFLFLPRSNLIMYFFRYVSTITMCIISIDRYCVVVHPLGPRITNVVPLVFVLGVIWLVSCLLSIPFAMYNEVTEFGFLNRKMVRCRVNYPEPEEFYRQAFTLLAFLTQYLLPLTIASIAYTFIALSMKKRSKLGAMTKEQIGRILKYVFCYTGNESMSLMI